MSRAYDPGLQPERTALAWTRTAVVLLLDSLLMLRIGVHDGSVAVIAISLSLFAACLFTFGFAKFRESKLTRGIHPLVPPAFVMRFVAFVTVLASLTAFFALLTPYFS